MNNNIRQMSNDEINEYVKNIKVKIDNLLNEYVEICNKKLVENDKIEELKFKAINLKKIYNYSSWVNNQIKINEIVPTRTSIVPKRGEIWTCELGQNIGSEENKIRPVIIIQNDTGNEKGPTTIIVPISNRPKKIAVHIELRESDYTLEKGERNKITGTVLSEQIKVVSKARLGRHLATLDKNFMKLLNSKLKASLKL